MSGKASGEWFVWPQSHPEEDPIVRMVSIKYAADVLVDHDGSIKWRRRNKQQL